MKSQFTLDKEDGASYAGQPTNNSDELLTALKKAVYKLIGERRQSLLDEDLDHGREGTYYLYEDTDEVDIGVGQLTVRRETIQDEQKAWDDAKEEIITELVNNEEDAVYNLWENNEFTVQLGKYLKGL